MKLIIQIPCYNEEQTLGVALDALPRQVPGVDEVEVLIIDDGSADRTVEVAREHGADHVVRLASNQGLARAFMAGLEACVRLGADVIVNTDADNQYCADDIPKLVEPIVAGRADMVIGARPISQTEHFSAVKKFLQKLGSGVVRKVSRTTVPDAPSGFRAISRAAAMRLNVFNPYTYTLETIIQAGHSGMDVVSVPIRTNPELRPSRLFKSIWSYVRRSMVTIFRILIVYRPMRTFAWLGLIPFLLGCALMARWLILRVFFFDTYTSRTPSLVAAAVLALSGVQLWIFAIVGDLLATNRKLLEEVQFRLRRRDAGDEPGGGQEPAGTDPPGSES
jgi:glycosyltransferase involved in cell wall biosynthesis